MYTYMPVNNILKTTLCIYDVIGGIVLMAFMYFMLYILPERNTEAKCEAESQQQSITD